MSLPSISPPNQSKTCIAKLASLNIEEYKEVEIHPRSPHQHDKHTQNAGILSPTRRGTRGSVTDFSKFLKSFNDQTANTKSMLVGYQNEKKQEESHPLVPTIQLPTAEGGEGGGEGSTSSAFTSVTTSPSPSAARYNKMRHTISAASQLKQHLTATIRPRPYEEEKYISAAVAKDRQRLAMRLHMLGFLLDPCLQALKQSKNSPSQAASLLLKWFPKGQGGRNLVHRMINVIEASERKLKEAHEKIKSVMSDGTPSERLLTVSRFFVECDIGDKGYLSPSEFSDLSSNLGVHLTTAELREAMLLIDEDGNGQVEMIEYIEWWGDFEVMQELLKDTGVEVEAEGKKGRARSKKGSVKSRSVALGYDLPPLRISPTKDELLSEQDNLGRMSPSAARNTLLALRKSNGTSPPNKTASDYLEQSMALLQRQKNRKQARNNIEKQIGMYSHIREGGWFDADGSMQSTTKNVSSPKTDERRALKAKKFASVLGGEIAKINDMSSTKSKER